MKKRALLFIAVLALLASTVVNSQTPAKAPNDPVVKKIIEHPEILSERYVIRNGKTSRA